MLVAYELVLTDFSKPVLRIAKTLYYVAGTLNVKYVDESGVQYISNKYINTGLIYHVNNNIWYITDQSKFYDGSKEAMKQLKRYHKKLLYDKIKVLRKIKSFL